MQTKITFSFFFICFLSSTLVAQISYTSADFAEIGDDYRLSVANFPVGTDFTQTGEAYAWDYSDLSLNTQEDNVWIDPSDSGYQLTWCFLNGVFFGCDGAFSELTNIAQADFDGIEVNGFGLTNVVTHYEKTESTFEAKMLGVTPDFGGLSVPFPADYTDVDSVYQFPIEYGNVDQSTSSFSIDFTEFGLDFAFISSNNRVNTVEGYGSLVTPYGEFPEVLKMKTVIETENEVVFMDNTVPTELTTVEYKWFAKDFGIPVLTATGALTPAGEVITEVTYFDSLQCLAPTALFFSTPVQIFATEGTQEAEVTFTNLTQNADTYAWDFGDGSTSTSENPNHTYTCAGQYEATLTATNSICEDGTVDPSTLTLPIIIQDTTEWEVAEVMGGLSVELENAEYQWLDCNLENSPIVGATNATFLPTESGSYAVAVLQNGCSLGESACFEVIISDVSDLTLQHEIKLYPNPTQGEMTLELAEYTASTQLQIHNVSGQLLRTQNVPARVSTLNFSLPEGLYFMKIINESGVVGMKKFMVGR